ncbi:MAG: cytochrome C oxidase subunit IV family protein [Candidatus Promineifilaceae bacterium]
MSESKSNALRRGTWTFLILMVLTLVEFAVANFMGASIILLFLIALVKAAMIVWVFMHMARLWREESH